MAERDYYEILGVAREATPEQIKKAYREKARKFHPDVNPGDKTSEAKFKEAQTAYDVLSDGEKRKMYDRMGRAAFENFGTAGPRSAASEWAESHSDPRGQSFDFGDLFSGGEAAAGSGGGGIFEDLVERLRGGSAGRAGSRRSAVHPSGDLLTKLSIPFVNAVLGRVTTIELERDGRRESLDVKIPPGVETGAKLRLKGQGQSTGGGQKGSLTIEISVDPHPFFQREGRNILVDVPISVEEAILGGKIEVPTLEGRKMLTVPQGESSGQKLRLKGQGVPAAGDQPAGDLLVVVKVMVPKSVDEASKELIRTFAQRNPMSPREGLW